MMNFSPNVWPELTRSSSRDTSQDEGRCHRYHHRSRSKNNIHRHSPKRPFDRAFRATCSALQKSWTGVVITHQFPRIERYEPM